MNFIFSKVEEETFCFHQIEFLARLVDFLDLGPIQLNNSQACSFKKKCFFNTSDLLFKLPTFEFSYSILLILVLACKNVNY